VLPIHERKASLNAESHVEIDAPVEAAAVKIISEPKVYSSQGDIITAAPEPNVTIRV
jgi:hypothetical protein